MRVIRSYLGADIYGQAGERLIEPAIRSAALTMSDPADLINLAIETLTQANIELPAFSALDRLVGHLRQQVHAALYRSITAELDSEQVARLDALLEVPSGESVSGIAHLKESPGPATLKHIRQWTQRLAELDDIIDPKSFLAGIAHTKIRQFAAEATRLQVGDLRDLSQPGKRHTLVLCLLFQARARTRDERVEMFLRRMRQTRHAAQEPSDSFATPDENKEPSRNNLRTIASEAHGWRASPGSPPIRMHPNRPPPWWAR